jgi:pimeloyl-ACP methyl ester carboxylesterase|tara:strand:- start:179413 stop:180177 length:765 start_codon:yes stop_codon:yes gene_type:complete
MSHQQITNAKGQNIAYFHHQGDKGLPTLVFCGGFKSDMMGSKATYLEAQAKVRGQSYVRFDYTGHGFSDGSFVDGCIGDWCADALCIIDHVAQGDILLAGSSMGGWISLLCAVKRPERIRAVLGIAAAPDFTRNLLDQFSDSQRQEMRDNGCVSLPNDYSDEPYIFTQKLIDDGTENFVFNGDDSVAISCPIYLVQGMVDKEVPWQTALDISARVVSDNVTVELIKDGGHSVSRPEDLQRLNSAVEHLNGLIGR